MIRNLKIELKFREKGTNRSQFLNGMVDKYTWVGLGSNYLMNEINAAYLWGNLEKAYEINKSRLLIYGISIMMN
jgi:dTDP-4-amino-4,6-dideoxygalactose transaminase